MATPYNPNDRSGGQPLAPLADEWQPPHQDTTYPQNPPGNQTGTPGTPRPGYFPPAKVKRKGLSSRAQIRLMAFGAVAAIFLGICAYVAIFEPTASVDSKGNVTSRGSLGVFQLTTGQCFNEPNDSSAAVSSIEAIPCAQPHDAQVVGTYNLTDAFYNPAAIDNEADSGCQKMAAGPSVDQSRLGDSAEIVEFSPSSDSWATGDRRVTCGVDNGTGNKLTGSILK
jgi:nitrite reductase/ring-hydroxylating ferredoxin subunit